MIYLLLVGKLKCASTEAGHENAEVRNHYKKTIKRNVFFSSLQKDCDFIEHCLQTKGLF